MSDGGTVPLRSRREPPAFRRVRVVSVEDLTPRMRRVVVGGDELAGFPQPSPASSIRLLLPADGGDELVMPTWTGNQFELPDGRRAPIRTFTPRHVDGDRNELTVDVVVHDEGVASDWVRRVVPGGEVAVSGPGRDERLDADAGSFLLVGDESALPAIGQLLEWIPADRTVDVRVEIGGPDARLDLPPHAGARVEWYVTEPGARPGDAMVAAVVGLDRLADAIWVAGEAAAVQRLRTYLFDERGRSRSDVTARGYWKSGRSAG